MAENTRWLELSVELQSLAQAGLHYCKDPYDSERYAQIRKISAQMLSCATALPIKGIEGLFYGDAGYQTPKVDTRAAVFDNGKILLVQDPDGFWSLPGGWLDVGFTVAENAIKEIREEAGVDVTVMRIIAIQDRDRNNTPVYAQKILKVFLQCMPMGGAFEPNLETIDADYFEEGNLPPLSLARCTAEQIALCFEAYRSPSWETTFE